MRLILSIIVVSFFLNCSNETSAPAGDCRQAQFACSPNFQCTTNLSGTYECLASNQADGGVEAGQAYEDTDRPNTNSGNREDLVQDQPDAAIAPMDLGVSNEMPQDDPATPDSPIEQGDIAVRNDSERCDRVGFVGPVLPQEAGHRAAAVLDPNLYPFAVTSVEYELVTDAPNCTGALEHEVELTVFSADSELPQSPSRNTEGYRSYTIPAVVDSINRRSVVIALRVPLVIEEDEVLLVGVQLSAYQQEHLCIARCLDTDAPPQTDWWSNADEAPYDWKDLIVDYQLKGVLRIKAIGHQIN